MLTSYPAANDTASVVLCSITCSACVRALLVGTWAAADWAIRFYRRHGFQGVAPERRASLLKAYWTIPDRQIATSVVLASPPFAGE